MGQQPPNTLQTSHRVAQLEAMLQQALEHETQISRRQELLKELWKLQAGSRAAARNAKSAAAALLPEA